jgi:hypothetical protein
MTESLHAARTYSQVGCANSPSVPPLGTTVSADSLTDHTLAGLMQLASSLVSLGCEELPESVVSQLESMGITWSNISEYERNFRQRIYELSFQHNTIPLLLCKFLLGEVHSFDYRICFSYKSFTFLYFL